MLKMFSICFRFFTTLSPEVKEDAWDLIKRGETFSLEYFFIYAIYGFHLSYISHLIDKL